MDGGLLVAEHLRGRVQQPQYLLRQVQVGGGMRGGMGGRRGGRAGWWERLWLWRRCEQLAVFDGSESLFQLATLQDELLLQRLGALVVHVVTEHAQRSSDQREAVS